MNATIHRANEIRKEAAVKFGGKPGDYSLKIACEMAKNGEKVNKMETITVKCEQGQEFIFEVDNGKVVSATINSKTKGMLPVTGVQLSGQMVTGRITVDCKEIKFVNKLSQSSVEKVTGKPRWSKKAVGNGPTGWCDLCGSYCFGDCRS